MNTESCLGQRTTGLVTLKEERGERTPEFLILPVRWEEGSAC